jgi:hypothetical protein
MMSLSEKFYSITRSLIELYFLLYDVGHGNCWTLFPILLPVFFRVLIKLFIRVSVKAFPRLYAATEASAREK